MKHARFAALTLATAVLVGCASVKKTTEGWWGDLTGPGAEQPQPQGGSVYYAASDGLVVHADASGGSAIIGRLTLYQRVVRSQLKNGWAYVTSDGGRSGWVDNAQLIWRLPAAGGTAPADASQPAAPAVPAPASVPAEPAPAEAAPAGPAAAPTTAAVPEPSPAPISAPAPPPRPTAQKSQPSPDMFDPF